MSIPQFLPTIKFFNPFFPYSLILPLNLAVVGFLHFHFFLGDLIGKTSAALFRARFSLVLPSSDAEMSFFTSAWIAFFCTMVFFCRFVPLKNYGSPTPL